MSCSGAGSGVIEPAPVEPQLLAPAPTVPAAPATSEAPVASDDHGFFHAAWCDGAGQRPLARLQMMKTIAESYDQARANDCRTAGLLPTLNEFLLATWRNYLIGFSIALADCPPLDPVPGGISVFGPANTGIVGLAQPALGRDDVGLLILHYMDGFAPALELSELERVVVEEHLWQTAEDRLDAEVSAVLSTCPPGNP